MRLKPSFGSYVECSFATNHVAYVLTSRKDLSFDHYVNTMVDCVVFPAPYISLMSIILSNRLGLDVLPSAFGQTQLLAGIASMIGPPIHGIDMTKILKSLVPEKITTNHPC